MPPVEDEIRELALQVASAPEEVVGLGAEIAAWYRKARQDAIDHAVIAGFLEGAAEVNEDHPLLVAARVGLRDRLRNLLAWARQTGRM